MGETVRCRVFRNISFTWQKALELVSDLHCDKCGECCNQPVWVNDGEIKLIARALKVRPKTIRALTKNGFLPSPCPFLKSTKCDPRIYPVRPLNCRIFPVNPCKITGGREVVAVWPCPAGRRLIGKLVGGTHAVS